MKPAWDSLGSEYQDSSSVVIGDVDCTVHQDLCGDHEVRGYPTIKYFKQGEDPESYNGGRDLDSLKTFVQDNLEVKCNVDAPEDGCTEKEIGYIEKMKAQGDEKVAKQLDRLENMKAGKMKPALKKWLNQRLNILRQLASDDAEL